MSAALRFESEHMAVPVLLQASRLVSSRLFRSAAPVLFAVTIAAWFTATAGTTVNADTRIPLAVDGRIVITGFSGTTQIGRGATTERRFIDTKGGVVKIFDAATIDPDAEAELLSSAPLLSIPAGEIGQVFGIALDDAPHPNIYLAATSAFGLNIAVPGRGWRTPPRRLKTGVEEAEWMPGQFGSERGGGPGSIWRIDGRTGEVSLFANVENDGQPNSGPGLGNIAFDHDNQQLFVSDFDSGLIHRLDLAGMNQGFFDHGLEGRPAAGLEPIGNNSLVRADITSETFDSERPETWGFTRAERRVWGLAYHRGRLYYAIWNPSEIWSIGITENGSFADDPRREIAVSGTPRTLPVSDIAFDNDGNMILAQRGEIRSRFDYTAFALPRTSAVIRYSPVETEAGTVRWSSSPEDYAIGFGSSHHNAAGGVALGYGYDENGRLDQDQCLAMLWATGDALRESADERERLAEAGRTAVHGAQASLVTALRPANTPPWKSLFIDYDERFDDSGASGLVGDIAVIHRCPPPGTAEIVDVRPAEEMNGTADTQAAQPEATISAPIPEETELEPEEPDTPRIREPHRRGPVELPHPANLSISTFSGFRTCAPDRLCPFSVLIRNDGSGTYRGPLHVEIDILPFEAYLHTVAPRDWFCRDDGENLSCTLDAVTLPPGAMRQLRLDVISRPRAGRDIRTCANVLWSQGMLRHRTALVQTALNALGYDAGPVDGIMGPMTRDAIEDYRHDAGLGDQRGIDAALMSSFYPEWGIGDRSARDDQDCAVAALSARGFDRPPPYCPEGTMMRDGGCVELARLCPANSRWSGREGRCMLPAQEPILRHPPRADRCPAEQRWDREQQQCACPNDRPVWDDAAERCMAVARIPLPVPSSTSAPRALPAPTEEPEPRTAGPIESCTGDRNWSEEHGRCMCPPNRPLWDSIEDRCISIRVQGRDSRP